MTAVVETRPAAPAQPAPRTDLPPRGEPLADLPPTLDPGAVEPVAAEAVTYETFLGLDTYGWAGVALVAFLLLLWRVGALRALLGGLDARAAQVRADLAEAAALRREAEELKAHAAAEAAEQRAQAQAMLAGARAEAERLLASVETQSARLIARRERLAGDRLTAERMAAEARLRERTAELALHAARRLVADEAQKGRLRPLTDEAIGRL